MKAYGSNKLSKTLLLTETYIQTKRGMHKIYYGSTVILKTYVTVS